MRRRHLGRVVTVDEPDEARAIGLVDLTAARSEMAMVMCVHRARGISVREPAHDLAALAESLRRDLPPPLDQLKRVVRALPDGEMKRHGQTWFLRRPPSSRCAIGLPTVPG